MGPPKGFKGGRGSSDELNQTDPSLKIWVGNLPQEATSDDLRAHFAQLQEPRLAEVLYPGVGCVTYDSQEGTMSALSAFNNSELGGSIIKVDSWTAKGGGKKGGKDGDMSGKFGGKGKFDKGFGKKGWDMGGWGGGKGMDVWGGMGGMGPMGVMPDMMSIMWGNWGGAPPSGGGGAIGPGGKGWGTSGYGWDGGKKGSKDGGGRGKKDPGCPGVFKVIVDPTSQLIQQGFPAEAPAILYERDYDATFKQSGYILTDLVGSVQEFCSIVHDPDWVQFPDVAKAVEQGGGPKECLAVATCPNAGKWAVGIAPGWKHREVAAKLALALALAAHDQGILAKLRKPYPGFYSVCLSISPGFDGSWWPTAGLGGAQGPTVPAVHWLTLTQESAITKEGFPPEAPCIVHGGKSEKECFINSHNILAELMEDVAAVEFVDDPDWTILPEVGEAMKAAQCHELPFTVAKSKLFAAWGVGVGSGWKYRESAAKLALGLSICGSTGKLEEFSDKYPEFYMLCDKAGLVEAGLVQPPNKRRKTTGATAPAETVTTPTAAPNLT